MEHTKAQDDHQSEQQRLEGQHEVLLYHMGKAIYATIDFSKPGLRILDSGCANGRWLRDLQASSPAKHEYIGTDVEDSLYPSPPPEGMHFQNQSIKEDFPSDWKNSFDLIHQRFVMAGAAPKTPMSVIENFTELLKPGGWMQLIEMNMTEIPENGPMLKQLMRMLNEMFAAIGTGANFAKDMKSMMEKAGLVDVEETEVLNAHGATIKDTSLMQKSIISPVSAVGPILQVFKGMYHRWQFCELDTDPSEQFQTVSLRKSWTASKIDFGRNSRRKEVIPGSLWFGVVDHHRDCSLRSVTQFGGEYEVNITIYALLILFHEFIISILKSVLSEEFSQVVSPNTASNAEKSMSPRLSNIPKSPSKPVMTGAHPVWNGTSNG